jgi:N-methylhydantoinase B
MSEAKLKAAIAEWADGCFEAERFVDDDGVELEKPVRIHVVVDKQADRLHFDFSGSADQTKARPISARRWYRRPALMR